VDIIYIVYDYQFLLIIISHCDTEDRVSDPKVPPCDTEDRVSDPKVPPCDTEDRVSDPKVLKFISKSR